MRKRKTVRRAVLVTAVLALVVPGAAAAHPDHDRGGSYKEQFPGEGVAYDKQHEGEDGHLPARQENVSLVGKGEVTNPSGAGNTGRVADVFAHGDYAYLTAFREPTCEAGGVHVMDISDLSAPTEVTDAFIPTSPGSYAGEGIQVIRIGDLDVLIHQNETCDPSLVTPGKAGGISLWDVSEPEDPQPLALHAGDYDGGPLANTVHSMYAWRNVFDKRTYVVLVDNEEFTDTDIMDITDPTNPVMVNDTLDLVELFGVDQDEPANLQSVFSHDMMVYKVGKRYVMTMSYWDGGYVLLDVTDPTPGNVSLIADHDYALLDEERLKRGHEISPEGNAHQNELSPNKKFMIATDEDFNPYRVIATIDSGPYAGSEYTATSASGTPPVDADTTISGTPTFVGLACASLPAGTGVALVERGTCTFQTKLDNITAAGYDAGIVFNNSVGCDALVTMLAEGDIPFVFTTRTAGLQLLGQENLDCASATPAPGTPVAETTIKAVFDGWGYVRLFRTDIPKTGGPGSIEQIDTYAIEESQSEEFAVGFGDLSVHEVAIDPDDRVAYLSYYSGGLRVVSYGADGLEEVGVFIDEGGNNFWGVEVYQRDGEKYILASDRDFGLYVFQYTP
ncbi:MAG: PA domain-containing protein [Haloechinothrix sp.]